MLLAHLLELPPSLVWCGFYSWPSSVTDIYFDERSHNWAVPRALHVADVSHLYNAGLRPQARGMGDRCDEFY
jgi:probable phosphoglycerate mutase